MTSREVMLSDTAVPAGHHHLVGGHDRDAVPVLQVRVLELPPPLLPDDRDVEGVLRRLGQLEQDLDGEDGDEGEQHGWRDRPHHLEAGGAVDLLGHIALVASPAPETHDDHEGHDHDEDAHHAGDQEDGDLQVLDLLGLRALGLERVERSVLGATRQREAEPGDGERRPPAPRPTTRRASIHIRHHAHRTPGPLLLGHHGTTTFPSITPRSSPVCVRNEKMPGFGIVTVRIDALPPPM